MLILLSFHFSRQVIFHVALHSWASILMALEVDICLQCCADRLFPGFYYGRVGAWIFFLLLYSSHRICSPKWTTRSKVIRVGYIVVTVPVKIREGWQWVWQLRAHSCFGDSYRGKSIWEHWHGSMLSSHPVSGGLVAADLFYLPKDFRPNHELEWLI